MFNSKTLLNKIFKESPDEILTSRGHAHWTDANNITFMVDKQGELVAGQGIAHNNIQNVLYYAYNWDGNTTNKTTTEIETAYVSQLKKIKIMADDEEALIKKVGLLVDGNLDNHVRRHLDEWAVGRMFYRIDTVSMWNEFDQLNSAQKDAIVELLHLLNKEPEEFEFEVNPEKYGDSGELLSFDEFMSNMNVTSSKSPKEKELADQMHTMEPRMKKLVKQQLTPNEEPAESIRKKREDRAIWNRKVRGEQFERIYDNLTENNLKYYAFDWDDNLLHMPTEMFLIDDNGIEVALKTKDYENIRPFLNEKVEFEYKGHKIKGLAEDAYINFRTERDSKFLEDVKLATTGPAWSDFKEAVNNGRIFSIITARGHSPHILKEAVEYLITNGEHGLNYYRCIDGLRQMHENSNSKNLYTDDQLFERYMTKLCKFYPVTFGTDDHINCHIYKENALKDFCEHVNKSFKGLNKDLKSLVSNNFIIEFTDDDKKNTDHLKDILHEKHRVEIYSTKKGKSEVESRFYRWKNKV